MIPLLTPSGNEFLESHGVSFRAGDADDGLAILHECGNFGLDSRGDGDYLLVGNERGELASGGFPELPLNATFTEPVTQVSLWAAAGVRAGPGHSFSNPNSLRERRGIRRRRGHQFT